MKVITILIPTLFLSFFFSCAQNNPLTFVRDGKSQSIIVIAAYAPRHISNAALDLQWHIQYSTGVKVHIYRDSEIDTIKADKVKLIVGFSKLTEGKFKPSDLDSEQFRLKTDLSINSIYFLANDWEEAPATHYAVCEFLERVMAARWLWPGQLGTVVEKKSTLSIPETDFLWRSPYDFRLYRRVVTPDVRKWFIHHRIARRREYQENSNEAGWHEKYYAKYPEIFARWPDGRPYNSTWDKLAPKFRLDNQKYFELVVEDFEAKGRPEIYPLFPTDGVRFDAFLAPGVEPSLVFGGKVPLTKYYLNFYQKFDSFVNKGRTKPSRFDISAYSAYYKFPDNYKFNGQNFNVWFVDKGADTLNWLKWKASGARIYLRPNWWKRAEFGPDISIRKNGYMFDFGKRMNMAGFKVDGFIENWSLQGLNYYVLSRQAYTNKTVDQIAEEYFAAFGEAINDVREYFKLCADNSEKFNEEVRSEILDDLDLKDGSFGSVTFLPSLYPLDFRTKLTKILEKGASKASGLEKQRVEWLMSGLLITGYTCDYVEEAFKNPASPPSTDSLFKQIETIQSKYPHSISLRSFESVFKKKFIMQMKPGKKKSG